MIDEVGDGVSTSRVGQRVWCFGAQSYRPFGTAAVVFGVGGLLVAIALYLGRSDELPRVQVVGLAMVLGGGVANLSDRVSYGFVRDFVQIRLGPVTTGIFNAADLAITTGVLACVSYWIWEAARGRKREPGS